MGLIPNGLLHTALSERFSRASPTLMLEAGSGFGLRSIPDGSAELLDHRRCFVFFSFRR